jgi:hypothetical protein
MQVTTSLLWGPYVMRLNVGCSCWISGFAEGGGGDNTIQERNISGGMVITDDTESLDH